MEKHSDDWYYSLFCQWQESGMRKSDFAEQAGLTRKSFYYWCKKFETASPPPEPSASFERIKTPLVSPLAPVARINYPSGTSLEFFGHMDADTIKKFL